MSGDMNTAAGNCLLMVLMVVAFARHVKLLKYDCLDDGDDLVLIIEHEDLQLIESTMAGVFLSFGMVLKLENIAFSLARVVFCQCKLVEFAPGRWKFIRDYVAVVSKALTGIRQWNDVTHRRRVIRCIGQCELVLNLGVPILQEFALCLLRNTEGVKFDLSHAPGFLAIRTLRDVKAMGKSLDDITAVPVLPSSRESFADAFGVDVDKQLQLERFFSCWQLDLSGSAIDVGCEVDVETWLHSSHFQL